MHPRSPFDAKTDPGSDGVESLAPVIRLRPIQTLVVSPDLAYRERAWTVLSELGSVAFAVMSIADPDEVAALLQEEPADVVLLDATGCETAAHAVIERLAQTAPRVGVVAVCHHCTEAARELGALPKWGWTQDLRAGVELAYSEGNPLSIGARNPLRPHTNRQRKAGPLLDRP